MLKASARCLGSNPGSVTKQKYAPGKVTSLLCAWVPRTRWLHWRILPNQNKLTSIFLKLILKIAEVEMLSHSFYVATITLIPKSDKHITRTENYRPKSLINTDAKTLNQMLTNCIQQHSNKVIYHDQEGFTPGTQGWFNIRKSRIDIYISGA